MVNSWRLNGKSSTRAKPRRYWFTSFAEGIFRRCATVPPKTRSVTRNESPASTTSSTSQGANCSMTFCASNASTSGSSSVRIFASIAASISSPFWIVVSEVPRPSCFTITLRRRWRSTHSSSDGKRVRTVLTPSGPRSWMATGLVASNTEALLSICRLSLLADLIHRALADRRQNAVGGVVHRLALDRDGEDLIRLRDLDDGIGDLLPRQLERVAHVVRQRDDRRAGSLRLELRVLVRSVHEPRDELQVARAVAELQPTADRAGGSVASRLEAGAGEEARVHP